MKIKWLASMTVAGMATILYAAAACAQVDLSGNWVLESTQDQLKYDEGPFPDMFAGIPVNEDGRQAGVTYPGDEGQELNRLCQPWPAHYLLMGPWGGRFSAVRDHQGHLVAWVVASPAYDRLSMTIWMDGRAAPRPLALHTFAGFSTGKWQGSTLVVSTSELKDAYMERNGLPSSSQETDTFFFTRHGDEMTVMSVIRDPVYLEAPWVLARTLKLLSAGSVVNDPILYCMPAETLAGFSDGYHNAIELPPREAQQLAFMKQHYNLPLEATLGGAQTMYPEFARKIRSEYKPPRDYCKLYCSAAPHLLPAGPDHIQSR
ncbi:MAG: hypothetical protein ACREU2_00665 [Steroidobacteraceae bacterium]